MDEQFWWKDPSVILHPSLIPKSFGLPSMINFGTKMLALIIIFGAAFYLAGGPIASSASIATLIYIISIQMLLNPPKKQNGEKCTVELVDQRESGREREPTVTEGFEGGERFDIKAAYASYEKNVPGYPYEPSPGAPKVPRQFGPKNPFKNTLPTDILDTPGVFAVTAYDDNKKLDDFFRTSWFSDPNDVFGKTQSQREFYTMPSTSVPNDRESYANWLYGNPAKTCKEGNSKSCVATTGGDKLVWLNMF